MYAALKRGVSMQPDPKPYYALRSWSRAWLIVRQHNQGESSALDYVLLFSSSHSD